MNTITVETTTARMYAPDYTHVHNTTFTLPFAVFEATEQFDEGLINVTELVFKLHEQQCHVYGLTDRVLILTREFETTESQSIVLMFELHLRNSRDARVSK